MKLVEVVERFMLVHKVEENKVEKGGGIDGSAGRGIC
jgi:hypothetical protein